MISLFLPFPPKELSPNARLHWAKVAKEKKAYRYECFVYAKQQSVPWINARKPLSVSLIFYPPDRRNRDWDNMLASIKSGLDGLSDAIGVDDKNWKISFSVSDEMLNKVGVSIE